MLNAMSMSNLEHAAFMFSAFVALLFVGSLVLPGPIHEGMAQPDGARKKYKLNGWLLFVLLVVIVAAGTWLRLFSLSILHRYFWALFVIANAFAFTLTFVLFFKGRRSRQREREQAFIQVIHDLFYGTEINPTWLGIDLKMFSYRPSLMGLGLLNVSFAFVQLETYGRISTQMWLYQIFYFLYLANHFHYEYGMLSTWDIIAERFGWMLVWGDYVLVPFFYSLPGWYLIDRLEPMPAYQVIGLVVLYGFGFWLFRGANQQKHQYKMNPGVKIWGKPAESIGNKLLVSGFWGIGRKLNYTGELCMYYAWTLPCGFSSPVPYLLPLWLTLLLPHRAWRDEQRCRRKYGPLWTAYCRRARFRMIPFIY
jgi:delta14-sterol reductase